VQRSREIYLKIDLSIPLRFSRDDDFSIEYINGRYKAFFFEMNVTFPSEAVALPFASIFLWFLLSRYRHFERSAAKSRNLSQDRSLIPLRFSRDDDFSIEYIMEDTSFFF